MRRGPRGDVSASASDDAGGIALQRPPPTLWNFDRFVCVLARTLRFAPQLGEALGSSAGPFIECVPDRIFQIIVLMVFLGGIERRCLDDGGHHWFPEYLGLSHREFRSFGQLSLLTPLDICCRQYRGLRCLWPCWSHFDQPVSEAVLSLSDRIVPGCSFHW